MLNLENKQSKTTPSASMQQPFQDFLVCHFLWKPETKQNF